MKIRESFTVACPPAAVWAFFQDVPAVAACLPGAELIESEAHDIHRGKVGVRLGPFKATFEGEARVTADPATRSGYIEGRGVDKQGGSHSRLTVDYKLNDLHGSTQVDIVVDLTLSGPIAQFGRTGLVTEAANVLVGDFARNLEARISTPDAARGHAPPPPNRLDALSILIAAIRSWLKKRVGRPQR